MRRAVPVQYPLTMFEEFAELENRKPFRLLMAEMILKNATTEAVIDRTCQIIDYIFLPKCSPKNWYAELSPCQSNGSIVATFKWNTSLPCRDGQSLPATVDNITCTYIPAETAQSIAIFSLTGVFLLYVIVAAIGFVHFRAAAVIKRSGQIFGLVIIFGSALCGIGIMLGLGAPSVEKCTSMVVLIALGFSFVFGSFIAKLYRIYIIFADNDKGVKKAGSLTDKAMSRYLIGIVIVEAICIGLWGFIDRPSASMLTAFVPTVGNVSLPVCKYGTNGFAILLVYNAILVLIAAYISFQVRKVPSDFNESKVMGIAVYAVTFIAAVVIPATTQLTNPQAFHSIILFGALLATSSALIVFSGPKLFSAFKNPDSRGKSISSLGSSKNKNSGSKPQSSNVAGSQSATSGKALETFNIQGSQP
ncbi:7 transmembrane sweet-taste receptor of 3 GCPR-domain-containing protein [Paraphysoderma sedebokerense]|nr:7 transmembrane sweet-taste receptor of 3 GCPR-domain-containing protein [Paraphysoderma sedebokerense]